MDLNLLSNGLLWAGLAVFVIVRQFLPRAVNPVFLLGLPLVAGYFGLRALIAAPPDGAATVMVLAVNLVMSAVLGILRGASTRVWRDAGGRWMAQGTVLTFVCWVLSIGLKVGIGYAGHIPFSTTEVALLLAVTFGAQNLVLGARMARGGTTPTPAYDRAG